MFENVYGVMMAIEQIGLDFDCYDKDSIVVKGKYKIIEIAKPYCHWSSSIMGQDRQTLDVSDKLATLYFEADKVTVHFSRGKLANNLKNSIRHHFIPFYN